MKKIVLALVLVSLIFGCKKQDSQNNQSNIDDQIDESKLEYFELVTPNTFADGMYEFGYKGQCFLLTKITIYDRSNVPKSTSISTIKINCNEKKDNNEIKGEE